jgi:hypothetical protein
MQHCPRIQFHPNDTGEIVFNKTCPCGEKFTVGSDSLDKLGSCAICKNRWLHCCLYVSRYFYDLHICDRCIDRVYKNL